MLCKSFNETKSGNLWLRRYSPGVEIVTNDNETPVNYKILIYCIHNNDRYFNIPVQIIVDAMQDFTHLVTEYFSIGSYETRFGNRQGFWTWPAILAMSRRIVIMLYSRSTWGKRVERVGESKRNKRWKLSIPPCECYHYKDMTHTPYQNE